MLENLRSKCLDPSNPLSTTKGRVISLPEVVNHPIKFPNPCGDNELILDGFRDNSCDAVEHPYYQGKEL